MADLTGIRTALAENLSTLEGIKFSAYMLSNPTTPSGHLYPGGPAGDITYHMAFQDGVELWPFTVQAFVALSTDIGAQVKLDQYLASSGTQSVKAALESDRTLGGLAASVKVLSSGGYRVYPRPANDPVLGAEWHVEVYPA